MRIESGSTSRYVYFVAVDSTDLTTRETGLSSFTVYRSRNGGAAAAMTTPTVNETDSTNMPGVYELLLDEDTTIGAGNDTEEMVLHITQASMAPVTRTIELYRPKITAGNTLGVASDGDVSGNVDGNVVGSVASVTGAVGSVTGAVGSVTAGVTLANGAVTDASLAGNMEIVFETDFATNYNTTDNAWVTNGTSFIGTGWNTGKTGYSLTATTGLGNQTADITGNLSGSVGSVTGAVGSVTGAVGSVTATVSADTVSISGDTTAADNLEAMYDGTGYTDDTGPASRSQIDAIGAASGGALNYLNEQDNIDGAVKSVTFVGTESSGTNASVNFEDGTYHQITHDTNAIDIVYQYDIGGGRTAVEITWKGYLDGANDEITLQCYNGSTWDTLRTISGKAGTTNDVITVPVFSTHTGTGADLGKVYVRLVCSGQTSPVLYTDQLYVSAVSIGQTVGYADGAIWVNTGASNTNTEAFVDGTADNPVSTWAAALTLASSVGLSRFRMVNGSSVTLTASAANYELVGEEWTLALGGQSIASAYIFGATVSGTGTGSNYRMIDCKIGAATLADGGFGRCALTDTLTMSAAGTYLLEGCFSGVAGSGTPVVDFGAAVGNSALNMRHYSGGVQIDNKDATGTDTMSLEGNGQLVVSASSGGAISVRGNFKVTNTGGATITYDDNTTNLSSVLTDTGTTIPGILGTPAGADLATDIATVDTVVDGIQTDLDNGTDGLGAIKTAVDAIGGTLIDSGTAQGGSTTSITLRAAFAATANNDLVGAYVYADGGAGIYQSAFIEAWNNSTKVATLDRTLATAFDNTTTYRVYGFGAITLSAADIADAVLDEATSGHTTAGTLGKAVIDILADTAVIGTPTDFGSGTSTLAANLQDMADDGTNVFDRSTDSLQALRDRGDAAWTTGAGGTPPDLLQSTTIATLASQTSFTLTAGSADDDAYNNCMAIVTDSATATQKCRGIVSDYTGSTKTVTLREDPAVFTMAVGDTIEIVAITADTADILVDTGTTIPGVLGTPAGADLATDIAAIDTVVDAVLVDTGTTIPGVLGTPAGADMSADIAAVKAETATIVADTNELQTDDVPGLIAALNNVSTAQVNAEVDTALADIGLDHLISAALPTSWAVDVASGSVFDQIADDGTAAYDRTTDSLQAIHDAQLTAAQVNAEVDTALGDYDAPTKAELDSGLAALNDLDATEIASAVWDALQSSYVTAGTFGEVATEVASILADTNELQTDDVPGLIAALNDLSAAQVNAEVLDVLDTDTFAELGAVPAANAPLSDKINWIFMLARNKLTQTATTLTIRNDADSGNVATSTVSDDGTTATRGEFS